MPASNASLTPPPLPVAAATPSTSFACHTRPTVMSTLLHAGDVRHRRCLLTVVVATSYVAATSPRRENALVSNYASLVKGGGHMRCCRIVRR